MLQNNIFSSLQKKISIYIVNLDRCPERYEFVLKSALGTNLNIERISAIDGSQTSWSDMTDFLDITAYRKAFGGKEPGRGTIACALSHLKAWNAFLQGPFEHALILEDDVSFDPLTLNNIFLSLFSSEKPCPADIFLFNVIHWGAPMSLKKLGPLHHLCTYFFNVKGGGGYVLNRKAAERLVAGFFPIALPVDHYLTRPWIFKLKLLGISPVVIHQTFGTSEIDLIARESRKSQKTFFDYINQSFYYYRTESHRFCDSLKNLLFGDF
jgi:glycosyl transferase, family 25